MMDEMLISIIGFMLGGCLAVLLAFDFDAMNLKKECEASLPRDQVCVMSYSPEVKK